MIVAATVRDIAIILVAIESMVIMALLGILIWQLWRLINMLRTEVKPIITDTQDTLSTVRGTATFMSENVVTPVMEVNSRMAGLRRTVQVLTGDVAMQRTAKPVQAPTPPPASTEPVPATPEHSNGQTPPTS